MRLPLKYVFVLRQVIQTHDLRNVSTVGAPDTHHVWSFLSSELSEAGLTKGVATEKDPGNLVVFIIGESANLAFDRLQMVLL